MLQFKRFLKTIIKYKTSTYLTLLSLVVAFLGIIILTFYISFENSFDRFNVKGKNIYRLETLQYGSALPANMCKLITDNVPEVEDLVTFRNMRMELSSEEQLEKNIKFHEQICFAGNSLFNMFSFPLISGDKNTALKEPSTGVISESLANKIYGSTEVMGKTIIANKRTYTISGIMEDLPENSSIKCEIFLSMETALKNNLFGMNEWSEWSNTIFILLNKDSDPIAASLKIEKIPEVDEQMESMKERYENQAFVYMQPLYKIHFVNDWSTITTNPLVVKILELLAIILAIMGGVNFINFSTSQAPLRAKSLAILRVMGGSRISSSIQIIIESILLSVIAMAIGIFIHISFYQYIEGLFQIKGLEVEGRGIFILYYFLFAIGFGLLVGLYPAYYITSATIVQSIKGRMNFTGKAKSFRNILIMMQFVFTIALIAAAITINKQLDYWRNFDLGINKEHVIYVNLTNELHEKYQEFADELMKDPNIKDYTFSNFIPGAVNMGWGREIDGQYVQFKSWPVDDRFIDFFNIKILEGRKFRKDSESDINTFIINKKAVEDFGWENPLEKSINSFDTTGFVIGVADNIKFSSLKEEVRPMVFWLTDIRHYVLMMRVAPGNFTQVEKHIKEVAAGLDPKNKIEVKFLDDFLNTLYDKDRRLSYFVEAVGLWTIILAITGLLGLVIFICRDKIKEIGIRKVNGATAYEIIAMINKDFMLWLALAFIIATPTAYYFLKIWLQSFAYKTPLSWWIFAIAGFITLVIEIITVSWLSWKTASRNPVEALRYE